MAEIKKLFRKGEATAVPDPGCAATLKPKSKAKETAKTKAAPTALTATNVRASQFCYFYNQHLRHPDSAKPCMYGDKCSYKHERADDRAFADMVPPSKAKGDGSQSGASSASPSKREGKYNIYRKMHTVRKDGQM